MVRAPTSEALVNGRPRKMRLKMQFRIQEEEWLKTAR